MPGAYLWAFDPALDGFRKVLVDDTGRLEMSIVIARLDDIADVNVPSPTDGYVLYWDETAGKWQVKAPGAVAELNDIGDVDAASPSDDDLVYWDDLASKWKARALIAADIPANIKILTITFIIDGGGSAITTGEKGHLRIPFNCAIDRVTMLADQSGSIVVDIWKDTYANFPPTNADSITASAPPTISTAQKSEDSTLTGWTKTVSADDILAFNVDSCSTITRVTISLKVTKT